MVAGDDAIVKALIDKLRAGADLTNSDIRYAVTMLVADNVADAMKADFLAALHEKGESAEEIFGFAEDLMQRAVDPEIDSKNLSGPVIDVCGTGGDGLDFFNVSSTIMFVLAAGGAVVVKHGNRGVTSLSGSADVLEALGIRIQLEPHQLREMIERHGAGFIFARKYHPAFRALAQMREKLDRENKRSVFSLLGPLINPARPPRQLIGVYAPQLTTVFAEVLRRLGCERAWIVHGLADDTNGMDDVSICGPTTVAELQEGKITTAILDTQWLGLTRCPVEELRGGNARENAATILGILSGEIKDSRREMTIANAAAGFVVAGIVSEMRHGIEYAREQIDSGRAFKKLQELQNFSPLP